MKTKSLIIQAVVLATAFTCAPALRASNNPAAQTLTGPAVNPGGLQFVAFSDSEQAKALHRAYVILAFGDHDYKGHRVGAMQQVKAAADLLGLDVSGDAKNIQPQPLSDDKMREAKDLIVQVLGAAEVKGQNRIVKHLNEAVHQINVALGIK